MEPFTSKGTSSNFRLVQHLRPFTANWDFQWSPDTEGPGSQLSAVGQM